jgi:hypothetical protein
MLMGGLDMATPLGLDEDIMAKTAKFANSA